jgi:hypothetical protein
VRVDYKLVVGDRLGDFFCGKGDDTLKSYLKRQAILRRHNHVFEDVR